MLTLQLQRCAGFTSAEFTQCKLSDANCEVEHIYSKCKVDSPAAEYLVKNKEKQSHEVTSPERRKKTTITDNQFGTSYTVDAMENERPVIGKITFSL